MSTTPTPAIWRCFLIDQPATTDPVVPRTGNGNQIYGPQFICNLEGLILEISSHPEVAVYTRRFTGERNQQWVFQYNDLNNTVALVSLHDGRYLSAIVGQSVVAAGRPYYWKLAGEGRKRYSLRTEADDRRRLILPTPPDVCCAKTYSASVPAQELLMNTKFVVLDNTSDSQEALRTGSIGPYAHSDISAYHTFGIEDLITIRNHLDTTLYAAVSGTGRTTQYAIRPGAEENWLRTKNSIVRVHLSTPISDAGEQTVRVCSARTGMKLHINYLGEATWQGIKSVLISEATYTKNLAKPRHVGIKNDLDFDIHVSVFGTVKGENTKQYSIGPGATEFWSRSSPETVFVGVGSAPGLPQAYVGRPGYILHIEDWRPRGVLTDDMTGEPVA